MGDDYFIFSLHFEEVDESGNSHRTKRTMSLGGFSISAVLVAMIIAVMLYRTKFGGDLATSSSEWSNFGGYIGGIFGPLVSFVTPLAVLRTVSMQRELLDTQKKEFTSLIELEKLASDKQDEQLLQAKLESHRTRVQTYQTTLLNLIETFISQYQREADSVNNAIDKILAFDATMDERVKPAEPYAAKKAKAEGKIAELVLLALEISVPEYEDVESLKKVFGKKISIVLELDA